MREAIGGSHLLMIIVTIIIAIMMLLAASISYTKAFKARNAVLNIIQKNGGYGITAADVVSRSEEELNEVLDGLGYKLNTDVSRACPDQGKDGVMLNGQSADVQKGHQYNFCVYHMQNEDGNQYYRIQTFMYFELPVFGRNDRFSIPIFADTYTYFKTQG